jgi:hypothetical protein
VLLISNREISYTHDLRYLLDLCEERSLRPPPSVRDADWLTPWAVAARYGAPHGDFDREAGLEVAEAAVRWARGALARDRDS